MASGVAASDFISGTAHVVRSNRAGCDGAPGDVAREIQTAPVWMDGLPQDSDRDRGQAVP